MISTKIICDGCGYEVVWNSKKKLNQLKIGEKAFDDLNYHTLRYVYGNIYEHSGMMKRGCKWYLRKKKNVNKASSTGLKLQYLM